MIPKSVGSIIRSFTAAVTRNCRVHGVSAFNWQRNYCEHIIRDGEDLDRIRKYVLENPMNWTNEENFPENIRMDRTHVSPEDWSALH